MLNPAKDISERQTKLYIWSTKRQLSVIGADLPFIGGEAMLVFVNKITEACSAEEKVDQRIGSFSRQ